MPQDISRPPFETRHAARGQRQHAKGRPALFLFESEWPVDVHFVDLNCPTRGARFDFLQNPIEFPAQNCPPPLFREPELLGTLASHLPRKSN